MSINLAPPSASGNVHPLVVAREKSTLNDGTVSQATIREALRIQTIRTRKKTVNTLKSIFYFIIGIPTALAIAFIAGPILTSWIELRSPAYGGILDNLSAAMKSTDPKVTEDISTVTVALCLAGPYPGLYTSILLGGIASKFPEVLLLSCLLYPARSADPKKFASFINHMRAAGDQTTSTMAMMCKAWEYADATTSAAGQPCEHAAPPPQPGCFSAKKALNAAVNGATGGAVGGGFAAKGLAKAGRKVRGGIGTGAIVGAVVSAGFNVLGAYVASCT